MDENRTARSNARTAEVRARKLPVQGLVNRLVRGMLRTPLVSRVVGRKLITLYVVGRKTGRRYTVPVAYTAHEGALLVGTPFAWARNLRSGETVTVRLQGRRRAADVQVVTDEAGVVAAYALMASRNPQFASFNRIGLDAAGNPDPVDLHLAWAAGARAIRLTPTSQR